jgi:hypothetical protein
MEGSQGKGGKPMIARNFDYILPESLEEARDAWREEIRAGRSRCITEEGRRSSPLPVTGPCLPAASSTSRRSGVPCTWA